MYSTYYIELYDFHWMVSSSDCSEIFKFDFSSLYSFFNNKKDASAFKLDI